MLINYIVTTQGSGRKVTTCETEEDAWKAIRDCSFGALYSVVSPNGSPITQFLPF